VSVEMPTGKVDASKLEVPMSDQPDHIHDAVRLASGIGMRSLDLRSVQVRFFKDGPETRHVMGQTNTADSGTVWIRAGLSAEDTAATVLHELRHLSQNWSFAKLWLAGRENEARTVDRVAERDADHFETKTLPEFRAAWRELLVASFHNWGEKRA
jgi:hypothetical protein